ncbi:MAG: hypothetical protein OEY44_00500 [Candidatus Peregrinibacteria bacterium]|nr:hypothetical protein [Candidatus Peregrinibacteria bacterium]
MENQNETIWITIPEERRPSPQLPVDEETSVSSDRVENKAFWGAGLVALIMFSVVLFAPQEFSGMLQAQLFDGTFQVVPDFEDQQSGEFFANEGSEADAGQAEEEPVMELQNETVVDASSDAVTIQIEPLADTDAEVTDTLTEAQLPVDEPVGVEAQSEVVEAQTEGGETEPTGEVSELPEGAEPVEIDAAAEEVELDSALADELAALSAQLEAFQEKEEKNQQLIEDLMTLVQSQSGALHGAADTQVQIGTTVVPVLDGTNYRYNTHTVTVSPHDVLAQNQQAQAAAYQASVTGATVTAYSNQNYNPVLAGVQGQPDTGPAEAMMVAVLAASLGILAWGSLRAARA